MPSAFTWLDYSEDARRRALDAIDLFREPDTRDELGLASIRDGFAALFSPGTSTIQTRVRYFLLVPWVYKEVERGSSPRPAAQRARTAELELIDALLDDDDGDDDGLIGKQARRSLKRLSSAVYWQGLNAWGIRPVPVAQAAYHRWIDAGTATPIDTSEEGEPVHGVWHAGLPDVPAGFPGQATLTLQPAEADYVAERLAHRWPDSLVTWLIINRAPADEVALPWEHPDLGRMPSALQDHLQHARLFSEAMHGAALLYNLLLARQSGRDELVDYWADTVAIWEALVAQSSGDLSSWDLEAFWEAVRRHGGVVTPPTRRFCAEWITRVKRRAWTGDVANDPVCENLVRAQEQSVKGPQARLINHSMLEAWGGDSGSGQLSYRWGITRNYVAEILSAQDA